MINRTVARRYAQALLMIAEEHDVLGTFEAELSSFETLLQTDPSLKEAMDNPRIVPPEKKRILDLCIKGKFNPLMDNFLHLIIDKRREDNFLAIIAEFRSYADQARNIVDAEVRSAVALTDKDFRNLETKLAKATGKNVRLKSTLDPSLIGGIVVRIGDTVIDGSVTKRLSLLRSRLQEVSLERIEVIK